MKKQKINLSVFFIKLFKFKNLLNTNNNINIKNISKAVMTSSAEIKNNNIYYN